VIRVSGSMSTKQSEIRDCLARSCKIKKMFKIVTDLCLLNSSHSCVRLGFCVAIVMLGPWGSLFRGEQNRSKIRVYVAPQAGGMDLGIGLISVLFIKDLVLRPPRKAACQYPAAAPVRR
jgi:hypothetical protein